MSDADSEGGQESPGDSEADLSDAGLFNVSADEDGGSSSEDEVYGISAGGVSQLQWGEFEDDSYQEEHRSNKQPSVGGIPRDDERLGPLDYLFALLPWAWWVKAAKQTNVYATQERTKAGLRGRGRPWTPTAPEEI